MDYTVEEIKSILISLAKKIQRLEDKNPDYLKSAAWNKYRSEQDKLYDLLRREQCLSSQQNKNNTPTKQLRCLEVKKAEDLSQLYRSTKSKTDNSYTLM